MHSLDPWVPGIPTNAFVNQPPGLRLEFDVCPKLNDSRPVIGRLIIVVWRVTTDSEPGSLDKRELIARREAVVIASATNSGLEIRVIEDIQHFRLQGEINTLTYGDMFCDG